MHRVNDRGQKLGVFSLKGKSGAVSVRFPDGTYRNHLDGTAVTVEQGKLTCTGDPIVITA